jgi:hypothetical protein
MVGLELVKSDGSTTVLLHLKETRPNLFQHIPALL